MQDQYREPHTKEQLQLGNKEQVANAKLLRLIKIQVGEKSTTHWSCMLPQLCYCQPDNGTEHHVSLALKYAGLFQGVGRNLLHRAPKEKKGHNFFLPP